MIDFETNLPVEEWRWNMKNISLYSRHFYSLLQHEQMKDKETAFAFHHMLCYVCSKIYSDPLNLKRKKKNSTRNKKLSVTGEVTIGIFSRGWFTTSWWLLIKLRPWLWGSTKLKMGVSKQRDVVSPV